MPGIAKTEGEWLEAKLEDGWVAGEEPRGSPADVGAAVFTLPQGYRPDDATIQALRRPRHYLIFQRSGPAVHWEIEHDPTCPREFEDVRYYGTPSISVTYRCDVADEVGYYGLDYLEAEWTTLPPGRYEIEAWHTEYVGGYEWEHGLRVVRRVPEIIATVVSV